MNMHTREHRNATWISTVVFLLLACLLAACSNTTGSGNQPTGPMSGGGGTSGTTTGTGSPTSGTPEPTVPLTSIRMVNQSNGWALTKTSILKTSDGGQHWQDVTPANTQLGEMSNSNFMSSQVAWVASSSQASNSPITVLHTSDGGQNWQTSTIHANPTAGLVGVIGPLQFVTKQEGWIEVNLGAAAGSEGVAIFHTTDGGQTWSKIASTSFQQQSNNALPLSGHKNGISFKDAQHGWATGVSAANVPWLYMTSDGGHTWHQQSLPAPQGAVADANYNTTPPVFFGNNGLLPVEISGASQPQLDLYVTHDGGQSWAANTLANFTGENAYVVDMQHAFASGSTTFYGTHNGGQSWQQLSTLTLPIGELSFTDVHNGWAIGTSGSNQPLLLHTTDGGTTWQQINYTISK